MPILALPAWMDQIEKEKIAIAKIVTMMMELIFANHAQYIVILALTNLINVWPAQLILIEMALIVIVLMVSLIMEKLFVKYVNHTVKLV